LTTTYESSARQTRGVQIQSVSRAVSLLMLVATRKTDGSGKTLAEAANLPIPTAHHLLSTLVAEGLLTRNGHAQYELGPKVAVLSEAIQHDLTAPSYLLNGLTNLVDRTAETCYIAAWRQGEIHLLASMPGRQPVQVAVPTGLYRDAHARASGKLFLAHVDDETRKAYLDSHPMRRLTENTITNRKEFERRLEQVVSDGFAIDEEEYADGVCCVSVPVVSDGTMVAAFSMSVPTQRWLKQKDALITATIESAVSAIAALEDRTYGQMGRDASVRRRRKSKP
jgi:IclR family acetate operon transcriptional repressor